MHNALHTDVPTAVVILPVPETVPTALGIVRALGRAGVRVVVASPERRPLSFASRYVSQTWACPDPEGDESRFVQELTHRSRDLPNAPVLFACTDAHVQVLQCHNTELASRYQHPFLPSRAAALCADKHLMSQAAEAAGLPVPRSHVFRDATEAEDLTRKALLPCFVKPSQQGNRMDDCSGSDQARFEREFGGKAMCINTRDALLSCLRRAADARVTLQVQEAIPGPPDALYSCCLYASQDGQILGSFVARKLRQFPYDGGSGTLVETVRQSEIEEMAVSLVKQIAYHGLAEVEFKRDSRDGQFKFIEVNARPWTWNNLGEACGVNLILIAYQDLIGRPPEEPPGRPKRVRWIDLYQDVEQFREQRRLLSSDQRTSLLAHVRDLRWPRCHAYFAPDDLGPSMRYARLVARYLAGRAVRQAARLLRIRRRTADA